MYWRIGNTYRKQPREAHKAAFCKIVKQRPPPGLIVNRLNPSQKLVGQKIGWLIMLIGTRKVLGDGGGCCLKQHYG